MRKLIVIVILLLVVVGGVLWGLNKAKQLVAQAIPEIERRASAALGTPVALGEISYRFSPMPALSVVGFRVGNEDPLSVERLDVGLDLGALLTGTIAIGNLSVVKPSVTLVQSKDGISVSGLPRSRERAPTTPPSTSTIPATTEPASASGGSTGLPAGLELALRNLDVKDATVTFVDIASGRRETLLSTDLKAGISLQGSEATLAPFSLDATIIERLPLAVKVDSAVVSPGTLALTGGEIALLNGALPFSGSVKDGSGTLTLSSTRPLQLEPLAALSSFSPALRDLALRGGVAPKVEITLKDSQPTIRGTVELSGIGARVAHVALAGLSGSLAVDASSTKQQVTTKGLSGTLSGAPFTVGFGADANETQAALRELALDIFGGKISLSANAPTTGSGPLAADLVVTDLDLGAAAPVALGKPVPVKGTVQRFTANVTGRGGDQLVNSLAGPISLQIANLAIEGRNPIGEVLRAVEGLPFMKSSLADELPPTEQQQVRAKGSVFSAVRGRLALRPGGIIQIEEFTAVAPLGTLTASGTASFKAQYTIRAALTLPTPLSVAIITKTKELSVLANDQKQIVIPVIITGEAGAFTLLPDIEQLMKLGAKKAIVEGAGKLLGGLLKKR